MAEGQELAHRRQPVRPGCAAGCSHGGDSGAVQAQIEYRKQWAAGNFLLPSAFARLF